MTDKQHLPMGVSITTFAAAAIAVGALWTRVEVLADDQVSEVRVVRIEGAIENIEEDVSDIKEVLEEHIDDQSAKQDTQTEILRAIYNKLGEEP